MVVLFPMLVISQGLTDVDLTNEWEPTPTATFQTSDVSICAGESVDLIVELTEGPSWTLEYSDGTTTYVEYPTSSPFVITVSPNVNTTYTLLSVSNSSCSGDIIYGPPPASGVVDVDVNPLPVFSIINVEPALCYGSSNGSAEVDMLSGTAPYSYYWDDSWSQSINPHLSAGTHSVTVTDANGCQNTGSTNITEPTQLSVNHNVTNVHCGGSDNGSISLFVGGGVAPYDYLWNNGETTANITDLSAGSYSVTVTDANGCQQVVGSIVVGTDPGIISVINPGDVQHVTCFGGNDGSAMVSVSGGTAPYNYLWSNGQNSQTASGLSAGLYTVTTTDANGCTHTTSINIDEPTEVVATFAYSDVSCDGSVLGTAEVVVSGGTAPYNYLWGGTSATGSNISELVVGNYSLEVTDSNGCSATDFDPHYFFVDQEPVPSVVVSSLSGGTSCGGDPVDLEAVASGGDSFVYNWSTGQTGANITVSPSASDMYYVTVTNNFGCDVVDNIHVDVYDMPNLDFYPDSDICEGSNYINLMDSVSLSFGSLSSVWFSGPFITGNLLDVSLMSPGSTYEYVAHYSEYGCDVTDTAYITLRELPDVQFEWTGGDLCDNGVPVSLTQGTPIGGVYSGNGVSGNTFDPVIAGSGNHLITYTYTNSYGCVESDQDTITVQYPVPITIVADATWCTEGGVMDIEVSPAGGYMTANGSYLPSNNVGDIFYFDPSTAGTYDLEYVIPTGCTASQIFSVEVYETPDATLSFPAGVDVDNLSDTVDYVMSFPLGAVVTVDGIVISGNVFSGAIWGPGNHEIISTTTNGYCEAEYVLMVNVNASTGIDNIVDITSLVLVYPNPVSDILNVEMDNNIDVSEIQIYNVLGKVIYKERIDSDLHHIDVSDFNPAIYFVRFVSKDGSVSESIKFIKQ